FASALRLPLVVIIQNNQVALGTRLNQYHRGSFLSLAPAYGIQGSSFDGNNVLDAYAATRIAVERVRNADPPGPCLLVTETFRMGGHATHDEREARKTLAPELFRYWGKRDPIGLYESYLVEGTVDLASNLNEGRAEARAGAFKETNAAVLSRIEEKVIAETEEAERSALQSKQDRMPPAESASDGVFSPGRNQHLGASIAGAR
ncbi:MAG TPA: thiamine pyrophosphate-dependent enzyme, partial [Blastocatellia bacterium]